MAGQTQGETTPKSILWILGQVLLRVVVGFHLIAIIAWSLPNPPDGVKNGAVEPQGTMKLLAWNYDMFKRFEDPDNRPFATKLVRYYTMSTGTWQYWDMFAPDPASIDIWGDAEIEFKDGTKKRWQYPRMYLLPLPEKYLMERYRKFFERASNPDYGYIFPVFAQRVAYINWTDPDNPPVKVKLFRHSMALPGIGKPLPKEYAVNQYYEFQVDQARLKEMKEGGWNAPSHLITPKP